MKVFQYISPLYITISSINYEFKTKNNNLKFEGGIYSITCNIIVFNMFNTAKVDIYYFKSARKEWQGVQLFQTAKAKNHLNLAKSECNLFLIRINS